MRVWKSITWTSTALVLCTLPVYVYYNQIKPNSYLKTWCRFNHVCPDHIFHPLYYIQYVPYDCFISLVSTLWLTHIWPRLLHTVSIASRPRDIYVASFGKVNLSIALSPTLHLKNESCSLMQCLYLQLLLSVIKIPRMSFLYVYVPMFPKARGQNSNLISEQSPHFSKHIAYGGPFMQAIFQVFHFKMHHHIFSIMLEVFFFSEQK